MYTRFKDVDTVIEIPFPTELSRGRYTDPNMPALSAKISSAPLIWVRAENVTDPIEYACAEIFKLPLTCVSEVKVTLVMFHPSLGLMVMSAETEVAEKTRV